ncbi:helix-turn-helix transcriptional regulator [Herbaspirillum lusitanum]|uniref:helix-turn-helix transcriptional regulator n=1 Tax=Herbaspirillum lusitanum TaxID=213312 RepID=UPI00030ACEA0|nr:AlpA family phage regulatory protein [Herbaspirillum lusitanum]
MVDIKYVCEKFSISRSSVYEMLNEDGKYFDENFPRPVPVGKRSKRWAESELNAYLEKLLSNGDGMKEGAQ